MGLNIGHDERTPLLLIFLFQVQTSEIAGLDCRGNPSAPSYRKAKATGSPRRAGLATSDPHNLIKAGRERVGRTAEWGIPKLNFCQDGGLRWGVGREAGEGVAVRGES